jgi:hypothetical protein
MKTKSVAGAGVQQVAESTVVKSGMDRKNPYRKQTFARMLKNGRGFCYYNALF